MTFPPILWVGSDPPQATVPYLFTFSGEHRGLTVGAIQATVVVTPDAWHVKCDPFTE